MNEISPKEPNEVTDLVLMEEGARAQTPNKETYHNSRGECEPQGDENPQQKSPQIDTAQHYLDDSFSDVMRSSTLGFNISSLFNTTAFNTTHNEQKVTLDWILLDGKNSQLETLKDRVQAAVTYITEYGNTALWSLENLAPLHKLTQHLQIVFGRADAVRKAVDQALKNDDEIRRKNCMCYLKPPKRFPVSEDMENKEMATWINWIHIETQALLEDLNEEIKLQNEADNPFTKHIVYAPTKSMQKSVEAHSSQEYTRKQKANGEIPPNRHEPQTKEKLASPLPTENMSKHLPLCINNRRSEILLTTRDVRSKPSAYTARTNATRWQINYDNINWDGNNTSYIPLPSGRQHTALEQFSINDTTDIRLCYRCGEEGHIRKYCNTNVHCEFCKSYTHHTLVCRSYANFVRAHPMALSRRTSPTQTNRQQEWIQEPSEDAITVVIWVRMTLSAK